MSSDGFVDPDKLRDFLTALVIVGFVVAAR
jgi:hypothetical protein